MKLTAIDSQSAAEGKLIRVGHSPDPDDAFMFYALAKGKIPMRGFRVEHVIEDIETLNQRALRAELEVTAVSCHAYAYLADHYQVMRTGASIGDQYGPVLVTKKRGVRKSSRLKPQELRGKKVAVPGRLTTAFLGLQLFERDFEPVFTPFDQIFEAIDAGDVDFGLVIHEGQITYESLGFENLLDLGQWWFEQTGLPLPLGLDVIRKDLGPETIRSFTALFKESVQYALQNREAALEYALLYGRGINRDLGDRFVGMYVNDYTVDLGTQGQKGLQKLLDAGFKQGILPHRTQISFVD